MKVTKTVIEPFAKNAKFRKLQENIIVTGLRKKLVLQISTRKSNNIFMMSNRNLKKHFCVMLKTFHQRKVYLTALNCYFTQIEVRNAFFNLFEIEHTEFFNSSIFYAPFTIVKDAGNIFSKRRLDRAKFNF